MFISYGENFKERPTANESDVYIKLRKVIALTKNIREVPHTLPNF